MGHCDSHRRTCILAGSSSVFIEPLQPVMWNGKSKSSKFVPLVSLNKHLQGSREGNPVDKTSFLLWFECEVGNENGMRCLTLTINTPAFLHTGAIKLTEQRTGCVAVEQSEMSHCGAVAV